MPSVNVVNGKQIVVVHLGPVERAANFFAKPFLQVWHHRDLVQAILRREIAERFKGSVAGWVWAILAPLLAITVGWAPGRSRITSSQRTGRPVANNTGMPAAWAEATAAAFCSLTEPSGDRKVPSRSVATNLGTGLCPELVEAPSTASGRMATDML